MKILLYRVNILFLIMTTENLLLNDLIKNFDQNALIKDYLCYKSIFCHKVVLNVQLMNFFI